jgi:Glycosyl hydrolases family 25
LIRGDPPEMEIFIDWESLSLHQDGHYGTLGNVVSMMKAVESAMPTATVGIYTGYYFFREHVQTQYFSYLKTHPLWLAWYTNNPGAVKVPAPWSEVTYWQWGTPPWGREWGGNNVSIDMNWFNGTSAEFDQRYGGGSPPTTVQLATVVITLSDGSTWRSDGPWVQV